MKIIKRDQASKEEVTERPLFVGGKVVREPIVDRRLRPGR